MRVVLFLCFIAVLALCGMQYAGKGRFHPDHLEKDDILPIRGMFLLFVFASHFTQYTEYTSALSVPYLLFQRLSGQLIVVPFLFFSGYGVSASLQRKGYAYLKSMPLKRIGRVLVQFDIAVMLFYLAARLMGDSIEIRQLLLSLLAWDSIGNSNWYVFSILMLYAISYLAGMGLSKDGQFTRGAEAGWATTVFTLFLIWVLSKTRPEYFYNTLLAYPFGFLYRQYQGKIEKTVFRTERTYRLVLIVLLLLLFVFRMGWAEHLSAYLAASVVFAGIVVMLTAKFKVSSAFLRYCGRHLFSLYILQRLPMMVLSKTPLAGHVPVFFLCSFLITFLISWLFDKAIPRLWNRSDRPRP